MALVGAGASVEAGLPTWKQLIEGLTDRLSNKANTIDERDQHHYQTHLRNSQNETDPWRVMAHLKHGLGDTSFEVGIKQLLDVGKANSIPSIYTSLWRLNVAGILTLNLDRLAARSFSAYSAGYPLEEFQGQNAGNYIHVLRNSTPFVCNMHGTVSDPKSWVMTRETLASLLMSPQYKTFMECVLNSFAVILIGVTAEDVAISDHLNRIANLGMKSDRLFWLTERCDKETDVWAEKIGVQTVRYRASDGHPEVAEFFSEISKYLPTELDAAPPVSLPTLALTDDLDPSSLSTTDVDSARRSLNKQATTILSANTPAAYAAYAAFWHENELGIHTAWFCSHRPPNNKLLGYTILEEIASGAFGTVYRAVDNSGTMYAIKVLHHNDASRHPEKLQSFRRGVRSMQILAKRKVNGIVPYRAAAEIPALTVMQFVEGPNLQQLVSERRVDSWQTVLRIATNVATTIRCSHDLPERVLHRDIRPANIMIQNGWTTGGDWDVLVLDFDLSWNLESTENSIAAMGATNGYLAPELLLKSPDTTTRSASVDSFGFGMTIYFLRTGKTPTFAEHKHHDWDQTLKDFSRTHHTAMWHSLSVRFFRLIRDCTREQQAARPYMKEIEDELKLLQQCLDDPVSIQSADHVAEELAARASEGNYVWDSLKRHATTEHGTTQVTWSGDDVRGLVLTCVRWLRAASETHDSTKKWIPRTVDGLKSLFKKAGWDARAETLQDRWEIQASRATFAVVKDIEEQGNQMRMVIEKAKLR